VHGALSLQSVAVEVRQAGGDRHVVHQFPKPELEKGLPCSGIKNAS